MKITISAIHLEEARFAHVGDYLAALPAATAAQHVADLQVQVLHADNPQTAGVRLSARSAERSPQYDFFVSYVILFQLEGERPAAFDERIAVTGATMLMPFVREAVATLTTRGRFGPVWLNPINFSGSLKHTEATDEPRPTRKPTRSPKRRKSAP